jgi:hypothetical protein
MVLKNKSSSDLVSFYNSAVRQTLDNHAPLVAKSVPSCRKPKWINSAVMHSRRELRKAERTWRTRKSSEDRTRYTAIKHNHQKVIMNAKKHYAQDSLNEASLEPKRMWYFLNQMTGRTKSVILPLTEDGSLLAEKFHDAFKKKSKRSSSLIALFSHKSLK